MALAILSYILAISQWVLQYSIMVLAILSGILGVTRDFAAVGAALTRERSKLKRFVRGRRKQKSPQKLNNIKK